MKMYEFKVREDKPDWASFIRFVLAISALIIILSLMLLFG